MKNKEFLQDFILLLFLYLFNPVVYFFNKSMLGVLPDATAYVTMAELLFSEKLLYIKGWGHIDDGLILSPLYPLLIAIGTFFSSNTFLVAEVVSSVCILLVPIPVYLFVKEYSNRIYAVVSVLTMQIMGDFFYHGFEPLTEALFMFTLTVSLYLFCKYISAEKDNWLWSLLVGGISSLVFFSRNIGFIYFPYILLFLFAYYLLGKVKGKYTISMNHISLIAIGYIIFVFPYIGITYYQTGQSPVISQSFRMNKYVVQSSDQYSLKYIADANNIPDNDYSRIILKRRLMSTLLPDSTEMLSHVVTELSSPGKSIFESVWEKKGSFFENLIDNLNYLTRSLGVGIFSLFLLSIAASLSLKSQGKTKFIRLVVPLFLACYIIVISLFTGKINRYVYVLIPLVFMQIPVGLSLIRSSFDSSSNFRKYRKQVTVFFVVIFGFFIWLYPPVLYVEKKFNGNKDMLITKSAVVVDDGQFIFATSPVRAYMFGGKFIRMPNDSLDKIYKYAQLTGVRYLAHDASGRGVNFYHKATWMRLPLIQYANRFKLLYMDRSMYLYEILY